MYQFPLFVALCDHNPPTLQTARQTIRRTDGHHARSIRAKTLKHLSFYCSKVCNAQFKQITVTCYSCTRLTGNSLFHILFESSAILLRNDDPVQKFHLSLCYVYIIGLMNVDRLQAITQAPINNFTAGVQRGMHATRAL